MSSCFTSNELRFQIAAQSFSNTRAFFVNTSLFQKRFTEDPLGNYLATEDHLVATFVATSWLEARSCTTEEVGASIYELCPP